MSEIDRTWIGFELVAADVSRQLGRAIEGGTDGDD